MKQYSRFRTSARQSYGILYFIIPVAIMISSTMFMELVYSQNLQSGYYSEDSIRDSFRLL